MLPVVSVSEFVGPRRHLVLLEVQGIHVRARPLRVAMTTRVGVGVDQIRCVAARSVQCAGGLQPAVHLAVRADGRGWIATIVVVVQCRLPPEVGLLGAGGQRLRRVGPGGSRKEDDAQHHHGDEGASKDSPARPRGGVLGGVHAFLSGRVPLRQEVTVGPEGNGLQTVWSMIQRWPGGCLRHRPARQSARIAAVHGTCLRSRERNRPGSGPGPGALASGQYRSRSHRWTRVRGRS